MLLLYPSKQCTPRNVTFLYNHSHPKNLYGHNTLPYNKLKTSTSTIHFHIIKQKTNCSIHPTSHNLHNLQSPCNTTLLYNLIITHTTTTSSYHLTIIHTTTTLYHTKSNDNKNYYATLTKIYTNKSPIPIYVSFINLF